MLDLSVAFDTVNHEILLPRLSGMLGISGSALQRLRSYLTDRNQKVVVNDVFPKSTSLTCGLPQGSVLSPILFTIYILPLGETIRSHDVQFHVYADQNLHFRDISISESIISPSLTIRNLGVKMDPTYTMSSHVSHLVQVAFLKLR